MELSTPILWATLVAIGVGTLIVRASFIVGMGRRQPSPWMRRLLKPVPAAVLSALVAPALFVQEGMLAVGPDNPKSMAGLVAAVVAWRIRNPLAVIATGMLLLWGLAGWPGAN